LTLKLSVLLQVCPLYETPEGIFMDNMKAQLGVSRAGSFVPLALLCFLAIFLLSCQHATSPQTETGIEGQIYEVGSPAVPEGWTPPPLGGVRTIIVSDSSQVPVEEFATNDFGAFRIELHPGTYFLLVRDTTRPQGQNGPFTVEANLLSTVKVYHDNGLR
jgi:hypothetical protein